MAEYFQVLSFYKKLKYNFNEILLDKIKTKFHLDGNRFEVLRHLDDYLRNNRIKGQIAQ